MSKILLGLDFGNGYIKIATKAGNWVFPSVLARPEVDELGLGDKIDVFKVETDRYKNEEYMMGNDVEELDKKISTNTGEGRYNDKHFQIGLGGAIGYVVSKTMENTGGDVEVKVVTGVPSREKSTILEDELKFALEGERKVFIDDEAINFDVEVLKIHAQPLGTIFDLVLSGNDYPYGEKYIGIIDSGYGTIDIDGIKGLKTVADDRDTFNNLAIFSVYQRIADYINAVKPHAEATAKTVERQFKEDVYCISDRAKVDIQTIKENIMRENAEAVLNSVSRRWQNIMKFDRILLTGGSAELFYPYLKEKFEGIEIVKDNQIANARGFFEFANLALSLLLTELAKVER